MEERLLPDGKVLEHAGCVEEDAGWQGPTRSAVDV
jgi:hypothetical protein